MANSKYLRNRPFLCVSFTTQPKKGVNTSVKGWMDDRNNLNVFENVSIVDRVGNKEQKCALIVDVIEGKAIKNTTTKPDDEVIAHYIGRYADTIKEALTAWAAQQIAQGWAPPAPDDLVEDFVAAVENAPLEESASDGLSVNEKQILLENENVGDA